ncbi:undecaprenyl-diphosphate phosphatase [Roseiflexus castenholzii]|jgi:undecaprenyl-diphosphatase|uniref:Undecaprenyl-diphosphatase n=1 Tax=Roseiflexus castenholzii (strain DSM 13941 / HLO8) TaxID=383372 RepID=A7NRV9_ROSCS|nr:undecaprenyl-diphosphate phosphatase [Roseiflexus castenholzii]ABU60305.1 putative undecaprenol kinase [Roseiflexus castenholzii DSM 13941]
MGSSDLVARNEARSRNVHILTIGAIALLGIALIIAVPAAGDWWKVVILGVVEGLTEFLPISSTGHLLIVSSLLDFEGSLGGTFEIFIQLGAVLAVVGYYAVDLLHQARQAPRDPQTRRFWLAIVLAFIPAAVTGLALHDWIKAVLFSPTVIGIALITGGVVLIIVERLPRGAATIHDATHLSLRQALGIGIAQALALTPGVSRSAASIIGGMLVGLDRRAATTFSFYLAIPTLGAATVVDLLTSLDQVTPSDVGRLFLGLVVSLIVAWLSIGWLLRYVANHSFVAFGIYRIVAGLIVLALVALGRL